MVLMFISPETYLGNIYLFFAGSVNHPVTVANKYIIVSGWSLTSSPHPGLMSDTAAMATFTVRGQADQQQTHSTSSPRPIVSPVLNAFDTHANQHADDPRRHHRAQLYI